MNAATTIHERLTPWDDVRSTLGLPTRGMPINITDCIVDRHVRAGRGDDVAMRFLPRERTEPARDYTFGSLADESARVAGVLQRLGVHPGDSVFLLAGRVPLLYLTALGAWRAGGVVCPLFAAFGPEPIKQRLELGNARVLVTTQQLYRRKVEAMRDQLACLEHVLLIDGSADEAPTGTRSLHALMDGVEVDDWTPVDTTGESPAILHFTSGTTGTPKGALHVHDAVTSHAWTARTVFDLGPDDVYWCTADPGWVTGTSYGIIAPLAVGARMVVDEAEFDAAEWYATLEREHVTVWYTAPTAIRMLRRAGDDLARGRDLTALRLVASVGEPLSAQGVEWGADVLGRAIHDTWWQTETGAITIANAHDADIRPGSMGKPVPGIEVGLLACDDAGELTQHDGRVVELDAPDQVGMIAIRPGWPSMFRGYLDDDERYAQAFRDDWYVAGDLARCDADGYYWFIGRADDVIKTAGHLIGPFEVESVLAEHDLVVGAGVYGMPDPIAGDVIHAEVVLRDGAEEDQALIDVKAHARRRLGNALAPRSITAVDELPYTRSGKVMRRLLRARALGLPEGDTSTLESGASS